MVKKELIERGLINGSFKFLKKSELLTVGLNEWMSGDKVRPDVEYFAIVPNELTKQMIDSVYTDGNKIKIFYEDNVVTILKNGLEGSLVNIVKDEILNTWSFVVPTKDEMERAQNNINKHIERVKTKEENKMALQQADLLKITVAAQNISKGKKIKKEQFDLIVENFDNEKIGPKTGCTSVEELKELVNANGLLIESDGGSNNSSMKKSSAFENKSDNDEDTGDDNDNDSDNGSDENQKKKNKRKTIDTASIISSADIDKVRQAQDEQISESRAKFYEFNKRWGRALCYVVRDEQKITLSTEAYYPTKDDKPIYKDTIPDNVRQAFDSKEEVEGVDKSQYKKSDLYISYLRLRFRLAPPQKILGVFYSIPTAGNIINVADLENDEYLAGIKYDDNDGTTAPAMTTLWCIFDDFPVIVKNYFYGNILEHEDVRADFCAKPDSDIVPASTPFTITNKTSSSFRYDKNDYDAKGKVKENAVPTGIDIKLSVKCEQRRSILNNKNYIPVNIFKTIDAVNATQAEVNSLNEWYIKPLFKIITNKTYSKYDLLDPQTKSSVRKTKEGNIESDFFTTNANSSLLGQEDYAVKVWYNAKESVSFNMPIKVKKGESTVFVKENLFADNTTHTLDKYEHIKAVVGDELFNLQTLETIVKKAVQVESETNRLRRSPFNNIGEKAISIVNTVKDIDAIRLKGVQSVQAVSKRLLEAANSGLNQQA